MDTDRGGKRAGKLRWVDRRRAATRRAGFSVTASGSEYQRRQVRTQTLAAGTTIQARFGIPAGVEGQIVGFGGYLYLDGGAEVQISGCPAKFVLRTFGAPDWGKFGSQWFSDGSAVTVVVDVVARAETQVGLYDLQSGGIEQRHLTEAREGLMDNMHTIAPEANFYTTHGSVEIKSSGDVTDGAVVPLHTKRCNRCGRLLPINVDNELNQLSFSNHCVAIHRLPCSHASFGRLRNIDDETTLTLRYGFQLECRFCKKFEVNSPHNPQRSAAQMKEDATRRRAIELLLTELYGESPNLLYRRMHEGRELADDVFERFGGRCFKCDIDLGTGREWHLDHTRPLAMLWPLDETATALCALHNGEKRDRSPATYYTPDELMRLAELTGIPLNELSNPTPNLEAVALLLTRLDWFFSDFLQRPEMQEIHDGKRPADLLVKALTKVLSAAGSVVDLDAEYKAWQLKAQAATS